MSLRIRTWLFGGVATSAILAFAFFVILDPSATVLGWVRDEPFFQGRSATAWRRDLRQSDAVAATAASEALANGGADALPVCTWLLRNAPEAPVRARAVNALDKMGEAAAPAGPDLVAALSDGDSLVRSAAARVIGNLASDVPGAVPALVGLFPDREAMRAVGRFKQDAAEAVPKLTELLAHVDPAVRRQAVRTLGRVGRPALSALPALIELVTKDPEPGVREFAAAVLGEFDVINRDSSPVHPGAVEILPTLVTALKDPEPKVRLEAVLSLGRMEHRASTALAEVKALDKDPEWSVRKAAMEAARKIETKPN
jgi:HEAT repeat protein